MNIFTIIFYGNVMMSHMGGEEAEFNDGLSWIFHIDMLSK